MKHLNFKTKKFLLSGLLVAVLGSQYYYSFSSISLGSFDLASRSTESINDEIREINRFISQSSKGASAETLKLNEQLKFRLLVLDAERKSASSPISSLKKEDIEQRMSEIAPLVEKLKAAKTVDERRQLAILTDLRKQLETHKAALQSRQTARQTNPVVVEPDNQTGEAVAAASKTEAKTVTIFCSDCNGGVTVTGSEAEIARIAKALSPKAQAASGALASSETRPAATAAAQAARVATLSPTEECRKEHEPKEAETSRERREREKELRECLKQVKEDQRRDKQEQKEAKERDKREKNNWDFEDRAEAIAERCGDDFKCKAERLSQLTKDFRGTKKVDPFVVNKAYNELIDKDLKAILRGEDGLESKTQAYQALEALIGGIPSEYKSLKTKTIDSLKSAQVSQAQSVNSLYRQADAYAKQNKSQESVTTFAQAQRDEYLFRQELNQSTSAIYSGLESNRDGAVYEYLRSSYFPDVNKLLGQMSNLNGISLGTTSTSSASGTLSNTGSTTGGRGGRTSSTTVSTNGAVSTTSTSPGLSGVQFGQQRTAPQGTRTGVAPRQ